MSTPIPLRSFRPSSTQEAATRATPPCNIPASTVTRSRLSPSSPNSHVSPPSSAPTPFPAIHQHPNRLSHVTCNSSPSSPSSPHPAASSCLSAATHPTAPIAYSLAFFHKEDATPFWIDITVGSSRRKLEDGMRYRREVFGREQTDILEEENVD